MRGIFGTLGAFVPAGWVLAGGPDLSHDVRQMVANEYVQSAVETGASNVDIAQALLYSIVRQIGVWPSIIILVVALAIPVLGGVFFGFKKLVGKSAG